MTDHTAEWQIGTVDLRRGLAAVMPHVNPDQEQATTHRVRIEIGPELLLMATDGFTAGLYSCDAQHVRTFGMDYVDLTPADVTKILAVFKAGKDEDADYPESVLEFAVTEKLVKIRDVSGMFAGHELELPATPPADFPNVAKLLADRLSMGDRRPPTDDGIVMVGHKMMGRFTATGKAIAAPLSVDTRRTPFVIGCSDVFVGMIMPARSGTDELDKVWKRQDAWELTVTRLGHAVTQRQANADTVPALLVEAIKAVGVRQAATVTGLAEALSVDKATATDLLDQMYRAQLIGPPKRGRSREVLYSPDEVDRALAALAKDEPEPDAELEPGEAWPGEARAMRDADEQGRRPSPEEVAEFVAAAPPARFDPDMPDVDPADRYSGPPDSPFSDPPVPPAPFRDSDGNEWPTSPFPAEDPPF